MSKHIKTSLLRPVEAPKEKNRKRWQRRKRLKVRRDFMAGWADRSPARTAEMSV